MYIRFTVFTSEWVPGASFQRKAREWRKAVMEMKDAPFATAVKDFVWSFFLTLCVCFFLTHWLSQKDGKAEPSFVANLLSDLEAKENVHDEMEIIKNCAGMAYAGKYSILIRLNDVSSWLSPNLRYPLTAGAESVSLQRPWSICHSFDLFDQQTVSTLASFVLAIVTHPEVQVKAQKELDSVVGRDRLPDFSDRQSLPYINAILKELLR